MKVIKVLTFISVFLLINEKLHAQTDYVITKNNDTIFCKIRKNGFNWKLEYRVSKKDKYIRIDPDSITEYFLADDTATFVYKKLPGSVPFGYVQWIERGRINLYENVLTGFNGVQQFVLFANKDPGELVQIKHASLSILGEAHSQKEEKQSLFDLLADNPGQSEALKKEDYDFDNIRECVQIYNNQFLVNGK